MWVVTLISLLDTHFLLRILFSFAFFAFLLLLFKLLFIARSLCLGALATGCGLFGIHRSCLLGRCTTFGLGVNGGSPAQTGAAVDFRQTEATLLFCFHTGLNL